MNIYLPPELVPHTPIDKDTSVDVRYDETGGRQFIVEMQMSWTESFRQRVRFNAPKAYVKQFGAYMTSPRYSNFPPLGLCSYHT